MASKLSIEFPQLRALLLGTLSCSLPAAKKRDLFLEKARPVRLTSSDIGFDSQAPVFINEHLCAPLKRLLGQAIARKRELNWKYVWVRNGRTFARHSDGVPGIKIFRSEDITRMSAHA